MSSKLALVGAALTLATVTFAQHSDTTNTLDEVTVTANKIAQKQSQTGKVVTVINKAQIEKSQGKTLAQLLNEQAGITINGAYNNLGSNQTIYTRGANAGRTLILVDGMPVYDPSLINNEFDINLLPLTSVERIEIAKGAQSTLYGSDAIGGVINIITIPQGHNRPVAANAGASYGSFNTFRGYAQAYGYSKGFDYNLNYNHISCKGFSAANDQNGTNNFDKDGYNQNAVNARLGYQFSTSLKLSSFLQYSKYKSDIDNGAFTDDRDYTNKSKNLLAGLSAEWKKSNYQIKANYMYSQSNRNLLDDSNHVGGFAKFMTNDYFGKAQFIEVYGNFNLAKNWKLLAGADYRFSSMNSSYLSISNWGAYTDRFADTSVNQASAYASIIFNRSNWNLEGGVRWNNHKRYGNIATYSINPSYKINQQWRVFASIASGFKAPTLYQLYSAYGDANLMAEKSVNYEVGVQQSGKAINNRVALFYRDIKDGIDFDNVKYLYYNFIRQKVSGIELESVIKLHKQFHLTLNYTFLHSKENVQSRETTKDTTYSYLLRRPAHQLQTSLSWQPTSALSVSISGRFSSKRYDVGGYQMPDVTMKSYFLFGTNITYQLLKNTTLFVDAQNLGNASFVETYGYNSMSRNIQGGFRIKL